MFHLVYYTGKIRKGLFIDLQSKRSRQRASSGILL